MKIIIQRETLLKLLQQVNGVVGYKSHLPVLLNVLLRTTDDTLSLTASDIEVEMVAHTNAFEAFTGIETTLPARKLLDICRSLPEQASIELAIEEDRAHLRSGKSRFVLATLPATDFPNIGLFTDVTALSLPQGDLKRLVECTRFAIAQQDARHYLNGMLLEISGDQVRAVATDGHRMAWCDNGPGGIEDAPHQIIVPRKGVIELARLLSDSSDEIHLRVGHNHIQFTTGNVSFTTKLIDGRFPNYRRIVPENPENCIIVDTDVLKNALVRVAILAEGVSRGVLLKFSPGRMGISSHSQEHGEAEEDVAVDYAGGDLEIGFNSTYLLDALTAIDTDQVRFMIPATEGSCLLHGLGNDRSRNVIMPLRT